MTPREQQQKAIVDAALDLLMSGGTKALRVRDIAEAAGCTTMTVYSRFGGKDGVVEAMYVDGFRRFTEALASEAHGEAQDRAERLGVAYRTWALANPGSYLLMFTEAVPGFTPSPEANEVALGSFEVLVETVVALQSSGLMRAGDPVEIAWALWGVSHGLVMLEVAGIQPTETADRCEAIYADALAATRRGYAP